MNATRILIVDDENSEAIALQQMLMRLGYPAPEIAFSGEKAVEIAERMAPDLVLVNVMLHGQMDGIVTAERVQACLDIPVIYIAACVDEEVVARAKATAPYGYVFRPYREGELIATIETALYKHKLDRHRKERERWFSAALRSIGDAVLATDQDGLIVFMNFACESLLGGTLEEVKGESLSEYFQVVNANTHQLLKDQVTKVLREGNTIELVHDALVVTRNGIEVSMDGSVAPVRDEEGNCIGGILVFRDVTERKQREEALQQSQERYRLLVEQLEEANRRKSHFIATLSHELRNPIAVISNCLSLLKRTELEEEQAKRIRETMQRQFTHLSRLVDDLLDITRIEQGKLELHKEALELNALMRYIVEDYRVVCQQSSVYLTAELPSDSIYVKVDRVRLTQVLSNLIQNAVKFSRPGGNVRVLLEKEEAKSGALIRIIDDGIGIPSHLFEPYRQGANNASSQGLGLGLTIAKTLVEMHGGEITAHSSGINQGSEFDIWLPTIEKTGENEGTRKRRFFQSRRRILIIEDNVDMAESLRQLLELNQHEVLTAYDGRKGIDIAREFHPDVVFCDLALSGMNGYEVARIFRNDRQLKDVYLVALSGYAMPEDLQQAKDAGFDCHLAKPIDLEKLAELLADVPHPISR